MVDGEPEIKICKRRNSGKPTKRHLSRRGFQKALGVAPTCEDSGKGVPKRLVLACAEWRYGNGYLPASSLKKAGLKA